jgi:hypothetical protein
MTEDDPTPKARQLRLSTVIRQEGAKAYFWRERLEDIAEGIDLGHTDKQAASQQLVAVMQEATQETNCGSIFKWVSTRSSSSPSHAKSPLAQPYVV